MPIQEKFTYPLYFNDAPEEGKKIIKQVEDNYLSTINWEDVDMYQSKWNPSIDTAYTTLGTNITNLINYFYLTELKSFVHSCAKEYLDYCGWIYEDVKIEDSWTVFGTKGNVQGHHTHGWASQSNQIAGAFYVNAIQDTNGGRLHMAAPYEPKDDRTFPFGEKCPSYWAWDCKRGRIILFPAWMIHWVSPIYLEDYTRISIAFNITALGGQPNRVDKV